MEPSAVETSGANRSPVEPSRAQSSQVEPSLTTSGHFWQRLATCRNLWQLATIYGNFYGNFWQLERKCLEMYNSESEINFCTERADLWAKSAKVGVYSNLHHPQETKFNPAIYRLFVWKPRYFHLKVIAPFLNYILHRQYHQHHYH